MATSLANLVYTPTGGKAGWRPPQWDKPLLFMLTIATGGLNASAPTMTTVDGVTKLSGVYANTSQIYVFDAVLKAEHQQSAHVTEHPVQTQAAIADHAYIQPAEITLEIGMSDVMDAFASSTSSNVAYAGGVWSAPSLSGSWSPGSGCDANGVQPRSVNAYQTLVSWASKRVVMALTTRLITYKYAMVTSISASESNGTLTGLRCRVTFKQLFIAYAQAVVPSARDDATSTTSQGQLMPSAPTTAQVSQYGGQSGSTVTNGGTFTSNSVAA